VRKVVNKVADTLSNKVYDSLLNTLTFFFGMDITDIDDIPDLVDDKEKARGLEDYTKYLQQVEDTRDDYEVDIPKVKEVTEEVEVVEPELETGVVTRNTYKISLPPLLAARLGDSDVDHSYPALKYLESLGYKTFDFMVNPAHKKNDICDEIARGGPWELEGVLSNAIADAEAGNYPVAPIFNLTHVNSKGYFRVYPPSTPDEIPDDAPGLVDATQVTPEQLLEDKRKLFSNFLPMDVTRLTYAPNMFELVSPTPSTELRQEVYPEESEGSKSLTFLSKADMRFIKIAEVIKNIQPITINKDTFIKQPLGFMRMLGKGFRGFIIDQNGDASRSYIYEIDDILVIPTDIADVVKFTNAVESDEVNEGDYILVDNEVGMVVDKAEDDHSVVAYLPEFGGVVTTDTWQVLETK